MNIKPAFDPKQQTLLGRRSKRREFQFGYREVE
jgi:hypothetical protein